MENRIYKYKLKNTFMVQYLKLPKNSEILSVINEDEEIVIYVKAYTKTIRKEKYAFEIFYTGESIDDSSYKFLGTVQKRYGIVAHIFYKKSQLCYQKQLMEVKMENQIYKYKLENKPKKTGTVQYLKLPKNSEILSVINQDEEIVFYAKVDTKTERKEEYIFEIFYPEDSIDDPSYKFLGTVQMRYGIVKRIFYKKL